jgi:hypothetical protein
MATVNNQLILIICSIPSSLFFKELIFGIQVLTAINVPIIVFWAVTSRQLTRINRRFGRLYLSKWRKYVLTKRWYLPTSPHAVTSQGISTNNSGIVPSRFLLVCLCVYIQSFKALTK